MITNLQWIQTRFENHCRNRNQYYCSGNKKPIPIERLLNSLTIYRQTNKQTNKGILLTQKTVIMRQLHHTLKMCPCYAKCSIIISIKLLLSHDFLRSIVETTTDLIVMLTNWRRDLKMWYKSGWFCITYENPSGLAKFL